jgi:hypothetical protein
VSFVIQQYIFDYIHTFNNQDLTFNDDDEPYFGGFLNLTSWDSGDVLFIFYFIFEIEGQHANTKAQHAIDPLASFPLGREEIS